MPGFRSQTHRRDVIRSLVGGSLLLPGILGQLLAENARQQQRASHQRADHVAAMRL